LSVFLAAVSPALAQNPSRVKVELLCEQSSIQPGGSVTVGFHFRMQRGWHIYWQNPGDSGQPPSIQWTLPEGFTAGDIQWPLPQRLPLSSLADYGYTNEVTLMVPLKAPPDLKTGRIQRVTAKVHWLVCQEICIPGSTSLNLRLPVRKKASPYPSRYAYLFKTARKNLAVPLPEDWKASGTLGAKEFHLAFDTGTPLSKAVTALFFPDNPNQVENAGKQVSTLSGTTLSLALKKSDQLKAPPATLDGILVIEQKNVPRKGYAVSIPLNQ
jgi:thiol:disulfide interchange protein DsbD